MERRFVKVEKGLGPQGRIAVVRFDRGDGVNAFSYQAMRELRDVTRDFEDDLDTSVVILTGSAKAFSAGFDLKDPEGRLRDTATIAGPFTVRAEAAHMSWGSIPRMIALMGPARTKQAVILASDRIPAADALEWGLVEKVVDDGQALAAAMEFAERIARQPPIPVRMTKTTVNRFAFALHDLGSHMDAEQNVLTGMTEDYKEGTSAFREKRKPVFKGR